MDAQDRYNRATGDKIERVLQELYAAEDAKTISDPEAFNDKSLGTNLFIFQAARRLVALGVSAASSSPPVTLTPGGLLTALVSEWLNADAPVNLPPPNPQPSYQSEDFQIWTQLIANKQPLGYLALDLAALTQGALVPPITATASASAATTLTFTNSGMIGLVVSPGMLVSGTNVPNGTTVTNVAYSTATVNGQTTTTTTVTVSSTLTGTVTNVMFGGITPIHATATAASTATTLVFTNPGPLGLPVPVNASVSGTNVPGGITVKSVAFQYDLTTNLTTTTVTLSNNTSGTVTAVTFLPNGPVTANTSSDANPANESAPLLTFPLGTPVLPGMLVLPQTGIAAGTAVVSVAAKLDPMTNLPTNTVVTLDTALTADVPSGTAVTFTAPLTLADRILAWLQGPPWNTANPTVATLLGVTAAQWTAFFTLYPQWLPPFTQPITPAASSGTPPKQAAGFLATRIRLFLQALQKFFTVSSVPSQPVLPGPGQPATFALPTGEPIQAAVNGLSNSPPPFLFGTGSLANLPSVVQTVFGTDVPAQEWLTDAMTTINQLWAVANIAAIPESAGAKVLPAPASLAFSVVEALYARGFRSAAQIATLTVPDFQKALTGTVAYDYASVLNAQAVTVAQTSPATPVSPGSGSFAPINPDGCLVNCVPPPCLSPFGPIAYLQEMLKLAEASTCETLFPRAERTLGRVVGAQRGPIGNLLASCANLETPLPLIDIVNECLESAGAPVIYNTAADTLAGHKLCHDHEPHDCHKPDVLFAALPEHSTPTVTASIYSQVSSDFTACCLPYSQPLDVSRSYLRHLRTSRFETMRTFRKCITEFALAPLGSQPTDFPSQLRRLPARTDIALEYLGITLAEYQTLFAGQQPQRCGPRPRDDATTQAAQAIPAWKLFGFASADQPWVADVTKVSGFLASTCLTYCEFVELQQSGFVTFGAGGNDREKRGTTPFPVCEPCCLEAYTIQFAGENVQDYLTRLSIFIPLWRKLREHCGDGYSFAELADICQVLGLYQTSGALNPDFLRQLAAFQMLRDEFNLPLVDHADPSPVAMGAAHAPAGAVGRQQRPEVGLGIGPLS